MGQEEKFQFETHWYRCQPQHYLICQKQFQRFYRNRLRHTECVFRWVSKNEIWHHRSNIIYPPFQPSGTCPTLTFTYLPKSYRNCHQWSSQALVRLPFYSIAYKMVLKISHGTIWCPCFCTEVFSPIRYCCNPRRSGDPKLLPEMELGLPVAVDHTYKSGIIFRTFGLFINVQIHEIHPYHLNRGNCNACILFFQPVWQKGKRAF